MDERIVIARRLRSQRLTGAPFASAVAAVRWFGAVQAQDLNGARWALGLRTRSASDAHIQALLDEGAILRTHVLRPTWHFVLPEDIRWLIGLTGPLVLRGLAGRHRQLGIDDRQMARASETIARALAGRRYMTRAELGDELGRAGIAPDGQRLPHLISVAELDGVIASGPMRGREPTYGLIDELVPPSRGLDRTEALAELARRYFRGHGPARLHDLAWWGGLTLAEARAAVAAAGDTLERESIDGTEHWSDPTASRPRPLDGVAHLLPNFDEFTVGYRHRDHLAHPRYPFDASLFAFGSVLSNVVTIDGRVRGAWRRSLDGGEMRVAIRTLGRLTRAEKDAIETAVERMARFARRRVELAWP